MPATSIASTTVTDEQIDTAILDALATTNDAGERWDRIRPQVPGTRWRQTKRLVALLHAGRLDSWICGGVTFVARPWKVAA